MSTKNCIGGNIEASLTEGIGAADEVTVLLVKGRSDTTSEV